MKTRQTRPPATTTRPPARLLGALPPNPRDFKAWQGKRMLPPNKESLEGQRPQALRVILPPRPGYPLLGCFPAEPNSVSPDGDSIYCHFSPLRQNQPNAPTGSASRINNTYQQTYTCGF